MFNADNLVTKQRLRRLGRLKFSGSQLITAARYLSGWAFPALKELYRKPGLSYPITIQPGGHLLLARLPSEYHVIDTLHGDIVNVCPLAPGGERYDNRYALSACGQFIISEERGVIRVREVGTGTVVWERSLDRATLADIWPLHNGKQWAFHISPIHQDGEARRPTTIETWDWPLGAEPRSVFSHQSLEFGITVSNTGLIAFPGFKATPARVFDLESGMAVAEIAPPAGNRDSGYVHWISDDQIMVAWDKVLQGCRLDGTVRRTFHLPTYSFYSVSATADLLALAYHDGFVLLPLDQLPDLETEIELSPPWPELPGQEAQEPSVDYSFVTPEPNSRRTIMAESADELRAVLSQFERPVWIPQVRFRSCEVTASKLGGTPFIARTENWPCCGVCSSPMELFLQLNSKDLPVELADRFSGLLQVFLCTAMGYSTGTCCLGYEGFSKASMLRLCDPLGQPRYQRPPFEDAFIEGVIESWQRGTDLPTLLELEALGIELSDGQQTLLIDESERFTAPDDKLGGWPDWPQNLDYLACPQCQRRMDVIFQFGPHSTLPHCFMDGGTAWVSQCAEHPDVLALTWNS